MLKIYDEPESPHEKSYLRCMMNLDRQMRVMLNKYDEPVSPHEGIPC